MNLSLRMCAFLATLLAVLGLTERLTAKPPDLPVNDPPILAPQDSEEGQDGSVEQTSPPAPGGAIRVVEPQPSREMLWPPPTFEEVWQNTQEARTGSLLFGVGVNSSSGLTGSILREEGSFAGQTGADADGLEAQIEDELLPEPYDALLEMLDSEGLHSCLSLSRHPLMRLFAETEGAGHWYDSSLSSQIAWVSQTAGEALRQMVAGTMPSTLTFLQWDPVAHLYRGPKPPMELDAPPSFGIWHSAELLESYLSFRPRQSPRSDHQNLSSLARPQVLVLIPSEIVRRARKAFPPQSMTARLNRLLSLGVQEMPVQQGQPGAAPSVPRGVWVGLTPEALKKASEGDYHYRNATAEARPGKQAPCPPPKPAGNDDFTCPYLKQQAADRHAAMIADPDVSQDVLGNLDKLEAAQSLLEAADKLQHAGRRSDALHCLSLVQKLCPGSRCALEAAQKAAHLAKKKEPPDVKVGEIKVIGNRRARDEVKLRRATMRMQELHGEVAKAREQRSQAEKATQPLEPGVEEMVRGLMKACRLAVADHRQEQAIELARQAQALDPKSVLADPLVYKMAQLAGKPHKQEMTTAEESSCPACPACSAVQVVKPLPPCCPCMDGGIVQAFEQLLQEAERAAGGSSAEQAETPDSTKETPSSTCPAEQHQAGSQETSETASGLLSCLQEWLNGQEHGTLMFGVGMDEQLSCFVKCNLTLGDRVYHLVVGRGCPTLWTTPNASVVNKKARQ